MKLGFLSLFSPTAESPVDVSKLPPTQDDFQAQTPPSFLTNLKNFIGSRALQETGLGELTLVPLSERVEALKEENTPRTSVWEAPLEHLQAWLAGDALDSMKAGVNQGKLDYMVSLQGMGDSFHAVNDFSRHLSESVPKDADLNQMLHEISTHNLETAQRVTDTFVPPSYNPFAVLKRQAFRSGFRQNVLENDEQIDRFSSFFRGARMDAPDPAEKYHRQLAFSQMANTVSKQLGQTEDANLRTQAAEKVLSEGNTLLSQVNLGFNQGFSGALLNGLLSVVGPDASTVTALHRQFIDQDVIPWFKT